MTNCVAGPRGSGRDLPALWAPRPEPAEPRGAGRVRGAGGAPRIGAARIARRLRGALGYAPGSQPRPGRAPRSAEAGCGRARDARR